MKRSQADFDALTTDPMPREKLVRFGLDALSLPDLLALVLGTGFGGKSVMKVAETLIRDYGNQGLRDLKDLGLLRELTGMPFAKACQLLASLELGRRLCGERPKGERPIINQPSDLYPLTWEMWNLEQEQMRGFYLNVVSRVIGEKVLSTGTGTHSILDPSLVFRPAVMLGATSVILAHNHPSGELLPSEADLSLTQELQAASRVMRIKLTDHLIVSKKGFVSLLGAGYLKT